MEGVAKLDENLTTASTSNGTSVKKDEIQGNSPTAVSIINVDAKILTDTKIPQVKLVRNNKKMRLDPSVAVQVSEKKDSKEEDIAEAKLVRSVKRSCELWSLEDKSTFFKAINEYGKDFDALQSYFLSQGKKKGLPDNMIKNKEQIRHFYYRTWLKISKHLKFSEDVKKTSQELYGLINYGELRRKLPRLREKVLLKLNELVYWGSTQVRFRGKTIRIKTPICRALRKLNQLEDWQEEIKLPAKVTIELRPGNNMAWWQVQAAAMNPRVRTLVPMQRRLSSLLTFLQQRWRPPKYKSYTNQESEIHEDVKDAYLLRVTPLEGCKIALPVVNLGEYLTSNSVSFNSYEKRLGLKSSSEELLGSVQYTKSFGKKAIKKYKLDKRLTIKDNKTEDSVTNNDNNSDVVDAIDANGTINVSVKEPVNTAFEKSTSEQPQEPNRFPGRETVERIRKGWTIEEANTITVGDLFLMFGRDSKVSLEYWWDPNTKGSSSTCEKVALENDCLSLALQKVLSLAKHTYGTNKMYGTTCGSNETVISTRIPSTKESTFKMPLIPQAYHKIGVLDKFQTRFCKRGRTVRQKSLVVQRVLPIIPGTQTTPQTVSVAEKDSNSDVSDINVTVNEKLSPNSDDNNTFEINRKDFLDILPSNDEAKEASNSIITSATQILKEGEQQWLNSEVADYSLSSFLGQLESPIKTSQRSQTGDINSIEVPNPPSDVVTHMQCLMGENSLDYVAKFVNLASQIASSEDKK